MSVKQLIVNADDFGLSQPVNDGIIQAFREGIVTSTTLLANAPAFDHAVSLARENGALAIGVHLNLVRGRPVARPDSVAALLDDSGRMKRFRCRKPTPDFLAAAKNEYRAQIKKTLDAGIAPSHIDFEKHHAWQGFLYRLACETAEEFGIQAVRNLTEPVFWAVKTCGWPGLRRLLMASALRTGVTLDRVAVNLARPDRLLGQTEIGMMNERCWLKLLANLPPGLSEVMVHPGLVEPFEWSDGEMGPGWLSRSRQTELDALLSPAVLDAVERHRIELTDFRILIS